MLLATERAEASLSCHMTMVVSLCADTEAVPSAVRFSNVTNNSALIEWKRVVSTVYSVFTSHPRLCPLMCMYMYIYQYMYIQDLYENLLDL